MEDTLDRTDYLLEFFKALADEKRLQIVGLLARQDYSVEELAAILNLSSPTVSHHLSRLAKAGLVQAQADQHYHVYSLQLQALHNMAQEILSKDGLQLAAEDLDLDDDFQHVCTDEPIIVESYRARIQDLPEMSLPITEHAEFLESSVYIQCRNEEIIKAAHELIAGEKDATKAAEKLVHGVYHLIKKNPTASLPSALDVLRTKEGDCNEHSILFTAFARAIGLPTKIYVGLVNLDGTAYFYHAWCAVWLGKWVPVDPTFDQFPADVGHLKLKEGELAEQAKVLKVVGRLHIDVLEYVPQ